MRIETMTFDSIIIRTRARLLKLYNLQVQGKSIQEGLKVSSYVIIIISKHIWGRTSTYIKVFGTTAVKDECKYVPRLYNSSEGGGCTKSDLNGQKKY